MHKHKKIQLILFLMLLTIAAAAQDEKKNGRINLQFTDNDTMHVLTATVTDTVTALPLQNVELTFYVQRTFGLMKVGEGTTDTTGIATAEFATDIRADESGKVIFVARVEDNDVMNDTTFQTALKPDLPHLQNKPLHRAMYARYAPWWLVITFVLIAGTVLLLFVYVLYLVHRIKKSASIKIIS